MTGTRTAHRILPRLLVCVVIGFVSLLLINFYVGDAQAGQATCPSLVKAAFDATNSFCSSTSRNQICYGHNLLQVEPQVSASQLVFDMPGDTIPVARVRSVRGSPLDINNASWGIALMRVQADISSALPNKNVSFLLFGDSQITNAAADYQTTLSLDAASPVNLRSGPATTYPVLASTSAGTTLVATGRLPDNSWLRVQLPQPDGQAGWVFTSLLTIGSNNLDSLQVVDPGSGAASFGPLQAFYLTTGDSSLTCNQLPASGLLIQTPEGVEKVRLYINEVKIDIGSTVLLQAQPGGNLVISTLEGMAVVEADNHTEVAAAGSTVTVPLGDDLKPVGPPTMAVPYEQAEFQILPTDTLDRPITAAPPLSEQTIEVLHEHAQTNQPLCGSDPLPPCKNTADQASSSSSNGNGNGNGGGNGNGNNGNGNGNGGGNGSNGGGNGNGNNGNGNGNGGGNGSNGGGNGNGNNGNGNGNGGSNGKKNGT